MASVLGLDDQNSTLKKQVEKRKKNSTYKYWKHLLISEDFENGILEWKVKPQW